MAVMLGAWRLLLALMVVNTHTGVSQWPGAFAVFSFYTISGYLMALILNRKYGFTWGGLLRFGLNRVLRIYPTYFAAGVLSVLVVLWFGTEATSQTTPAVVLPTSAGALLQTLTLWSKTNSLVPPAWSLHVEVMFYLLIALGLGRSLRVATCWAAVSVGYIVYRQTTGAMTWEEQYYSTLAGSLPFSLGCLLFHMSGRLRGIYRMEGRRGLLLGSAFYALPFVLAASGLTDPKGWVFYLNLAGSVLLLQALSQQKFKSGSLAARLDHAMGNLSFPVYIFHWQVTLACVMMGMSRGTVLAVLIVGGISVGLALIENWMLSARIERVRTAIAKSREPVLESIPIGMPILTKTRRAA
ncbi:MAG: acyltransferase [Phycisphaeraceae bacterium]|nr:acyltransferase [Phycisphaeraceae bacterium]